METLLSKSSRGWLAILGLLMGVAVVWFYQSSSTESEIGGWGFELPNKDVSSASDLGKLIAARLACNMDRLACLAQAHQRDYIDLLNKQGVKPAGDTVFMRRPLLFKGQQALPNEALQTFQLAALSPTPKAKLNIYRGLTQHAQAAVQYRAWLGLARVHLQNQDIVKLTEAAQQALQVSVPDLWYADAYFLLAQGRLLQGLADQQTRDLLSQAIQRDAAFMQAYQSYLLALQRDPEFPQSCTQVVDAIEKLEILGTWTQDVRKFARLAEQLLELGSASGTRDFLVGYLYYLSKDKHLALKYLERLTSIPGNCVELSEHAQNLSRALHP